MMMIRGSDEPARFKVSFYRDALFATALLARLLCLTMVAPLIRQPE
jgi:hypothetical protein